VGKRGAAQIGVQDYAGGVDDAAERWGEGDFDFLNDGDNDFGDDFGDDANFQLGLVECFRIWNGRLQWLVLQARAEVGEDLADGLRDEAAAGFFGQSDEAR